MNYIGFSSENFVDKDTEFFCCIICSDIVVNPKMCAICNHIFCAKCIEEWHSTNKFCPFKCKDREEMQFIPIPKSVQTMYDNLKVTCSKINCGKIVPLKDLFKHENNCGNYNCENFEKCGKSAPLKILDERVCSEKCYIYLKLKKGEDIENERLFQLLQNFSENLSYDVGTIRSFYCFWETCNMGLSVIGRGGVVENQSELKCFKSAIGAYVRLKFFFEKILF